MSFLNHEVTKTRSKYKPYPSYKTSRVEWLSELPSAWGLVRVKNESTLKARIGWQNLRTEEFIDEGPFCVTGTDFKNGSINWVTAYHVSEKRYVLDKNIQLQDGDLLITKDGTIGKLAIVDNLKDGQATLNSGVFIFRPNNRVLKTKFMYWVMSSSIFSNFVKYVSNGSTINHLYQADFYNMYFGLPSLNEQQSISKFLNQETSKMDLLIEKQQVMIALLKEKRQAVISHAVTKGLNPKTPLKDSGIKWLGQIPEHWNVVTVSRTFYLQAGGDLKKEYFSYTKDEEHPYPIFTNTTKVQKPYGYTSKAIFKGNTLTVTGRGDVGFAVYRKAPFDAIIRLLVLTPKHDQINCKFFEHFINSKLEFNEESSAINQLSTNQIAPYQLVLPPLVEQIEVVEYLHGQTQKIDTLIEKSQQAIALLKERKTALISAAVTGKIDVRGVS